MPRNEISNSDDVIDSRDVIERVKELQDERNSLLEDIEEAESTLAETAEEDSEDYKAAAEAVDEAKDALTAWDADNGDELRALLALQEEAKGYAPDWRYGATLIRDSYFADYCEELVKDIGDLPQNIPDYLVIDWDATVENLKVDYTEVDFDGVTYWIR